jgi:predicted  nucleic acid-binding Zn-ribbon protein
MSRPENLLRLQITDSQLDAHNARLKEIEIALADDKLIKAAQAVAETKQEKLEKVQKDLRAAKHDVQNQRDKIKQSESRLYGGSIRDPKELQDIQEEVLALKRYLEVLEERQLESMLALDDAQSEFDEAQEHLNQTCAQSEENNSHLIAEKTTLTNEVRQLREKRQSQTIIPDEADLKLYESIRAKRGGVGVAKVVERACSACGATLGTASLQAARSPSQITRCATCDRIVYAE